MLKTLIKLRLKGIFLRQTRSSKKVKKNIGKIVLMVVLFGYVGIFFRNVWSIILFNCGCFTFYEYR